MLGRLKWTCQPFGGQVLIDELETCESNGYHRVGRFLGSACRLFQEIGVVDMAVSTLKSTVTGWHSQQPPWPVNAGDICRFHQRKPAKMGKLQPKPTTSQSKGL